MNEGPPRDDSAAANFTADSNADRIKLSGESHPGQPLDGSDEMLHNVPSLL